MIGVLIPTQHKRDFFLEQALNMLELQTIVMIDDTYLRDKKYDEQDKELYLKRKENNFDIKIN